MPTRYVVHKSQPGAVAREVIHDLGETLILRFGPNGDGRQPVRADDYELDLATCEDLDELARECRRLSHLTGVHISSQTDPVSMARDLAGVLRGWAAREKMLREK